MKMIKLLIPAAVLIAMLFISGCDTFEDFSVNVPFEIVFRDSTFNETTSKTATYDLDENSVYNEYKDRIEEFEFFEAKYIVTDIEPDSMTGNITLTIKQGGEDGQILLQEIREFDPETDLNVSHTILLTQDQISMFNNYLIATGTKVFHGESVITNITPADNEIEKIVTVKLHLLLKAKGTL